MVIKIFDEKSQIGVKQFSTDEIVIGKGTELSLESPEVSFVHANIERKENRYFLSDLGSQSGTFLNGEKISLDKELSNKDKIQIGPFTLEFHLKTVEEATPSKEESNKEKKATPPVPPPPPLPSKPPDGVPKLPSGDSIQVAPFGKDIPASSVSSASSASSGLNDLIKPQKGESVEVLAVWGDRILSSYHFSDKQTVQVGLSQSNDIVMPLVKGVSKFSFLKIDKQVKVFLTSDMTGQLITSDGRQESLSSLSESKRLVLTKSGIYELTLQQGELLRLKTVSSDVLFYVRYAPKTAKPILATPLFMSPSEITGVVLSALLIMLWGLYMFIYAPSEISNQEDEKTIRISKFIYKLPPKQLQKVEVKPTKKLVKVPVRSKSKAKPKSKAKRKNKALKTKKVRGKVSRVKKFKTKRKRPKKFTSTKQGGSIKTGKKSGSGAKSRKKDVSKLGLFSAFGNKGTREKLDQTYSGAGGLLGLADKATGSSGMAKNRAGSDIGSKLKSTGAAGKGVSTQGIAGVDTKGRSTGQLGYGETSLGGKRSTEVVFGGQEEEFVGSIDRDAVRRVVKAGLPEFRSCYERALNRSTRLSGKVVLQWTIVAQGRATGVFVKSSTLGNRGMEECMKQRLVGWKFPVPPRGTYAEVTYPFVFNSVR